MYVFAPWRTNADCCTISNNFTILLLLLITLSPHCRRHHQHQHRRQRHHHLHHCCHHRLSMCTSTQPNVFTTIYTQEGSGGNVREIKGPWRFYRSHRPLCLVSHKHKKKKQEGCTSLPVNSTFVQKVSLAFRSRFVTKD